MQDEKLPFFLSQNSGFGRIRPEDELLHPESFENVPDDSATETQYFGFSIPQENIHALCYMWHRPNLHIVSGGVFAFQGIKPTTPHAELCDYKSFMSDRALKNDLHEYRLDNGFGVKVLEPLKKFHVTYADKERQNSVDVIFEALQPAVMFADGKHFEQPMSAKGELVLRGRHHEVDSFTIRDRSWGKPRPEGPLAIPPTSWMIGVFDKNFSFNCCVLDQGSHNPSLEGSLSVPDEKALSGGWVYHGGTLGRIVRASKRVVRDQTSLVAKRIELEFTDDANRTFDLRGTTIAACPFPSVVNKYSMINLVRWECEGMVGYGDSQESFMGDYLNARK